MSAWNYLRHSLRELDLVPLLQEDRLLITTPEEAEGLAETRVYPVADIMLTDRTPPRGQLFLPPLVQREDAVERRLRRNSGGPCPFIIGICQFEFVVEDFARRFGDNVLVDSRALEDIGVALDSPVTERGRDLPAGLALRRILRALDLDFRLDGEAVVITTPEEVESRLKIRLHAARGVVAGFPQPVVPEGLGMGTIGANPFMLGGGMGGFGGGMGMGSGMGGFGGGFFGGWWRDVRRRRDATAVRDQCYSSHGRGAGRGGFLQRWRRGRTACAGYRGSSNRGRRSRRVRKNKP